MTVLDNSVAILHGSVDNSLRWMWLSPKLGTVCLARVDRTGFFLTDHGAPGLHDIGAQLPRLWSYQISGVDLSGHATHMLEAPQMQNIVPIPGTASVDEFQTEVMF